MLTSHSFPTSPKMLTSHYEQGLRQLLYSRLAVRQEASSDSDDDDDDDESSKDDHAQAQAQAKAMMSSISQLSFPESKRGFHACKFVISIMPHHCDEFSPTVNEILGFCHTNDIRVDSTGWLCRDNQWYEHVESKKTKFISSDDHYRELINLANKHDHYRELINLANKRGMKLSRSSGGLATMA